MSTLVNSLIQQGDDSIKKTVDEKNDAAADAVARLFSLVNAGKLDVSVLDNLIAFAENPTAPTGAKALGAGSTDEQEALQVLLNSNKLQDNVKKGLEKLIKGELQLDNDGNPVATSAAADPKLQQEVTDLRTKTKTQGDVLNDIAATCKATITGGDYSKLPNSVKDFAKAEADKATKAESDKHKDTLPKADVKKAADDILAWVNEGKKAMTGGMKFSEDDYNGLKNRAEGLQADADK